MRPWPWACKDPSDAPTARIRASRSRSREIAGRGAPKPCGTQTDSLAKERSTRRSHPRPGPPRRSESGADPRSATPVSSSSCRSLALPAHPLPDVRRAMLQLDARCFAGDEEAHDGAVNERHIAQVEHEPRAVRPDLRPELVQVFGLDTPNEPERRRAAVGRCFDHEGHVLRSTITGG